jgi:hypothetical protein
MTEIHCLQLQTMKGGFKIFMFRHFLDAFTKLGKASFSFIMSICLFAGNDLALTG